MKRNLSNNMLKGLVAAALLFCLPSLKALAQPASSYGFTATTGTYTALTGATELVDVETDDNSSGMIPIGFNFNFCGTNYATCKVNSNGWISFADCYPFPWEMRENETYNLALMTPMLQPLWDDEMGDFFVGGYAAYKTEGTTPNQVFTVEWRNWTWFWYLGVATISYQVKLYESSNIIEYIYRQEPGMLDGFSESATIGIANTDTDFQTLDNASTNPTPSASIFYNFVNQKPATNQVYRWTPPPPCNGTPNAGNATASITTLACEGNANLTLSGSTIATELEYQWQYSTDGTNWFNLGTSQTTMASNTGSITTTTQFRCIVTCITTSQSATSQPVTVTVTAPVPGVSTAVPPVICNGGSSLIGLSGATTNGVSYQWQSSPNNTVYTNISGGNSSTYTTPPLNAPIFYQAVLTCTVNGLSSTSTPVNVDTLPSAAPVVTPSSLTITCGQPATFTGTPVAGGTISWYNQPTGGTLLATGSTASLFPTTSGTYYAENNIPPTIQSTNSSNSAIVDHDALTGDDRGGIAVSGNYLYVTGDNNTARYNKNTLTGGISLPRTDGLFADQGQTLYALGNASGTGTDYYFTGGLVDRIFKMDPDLNPIGAPVMLSTPINVPSFDNGNFLAPGEGYVIYYQGNSQTFYRISLSTGNVTTITNTLPFFNYIYSESFASRGWAEYDGADYYIFFSEDTYSNITKMNLTTGQQTQIGNFIYLSDFHSIAFDITTSRMYFHFEYYSDDFGGNFESCGYTEAIFGTSVCGANTRTPVQVTVNPIVPTINPTGTVNICNTGSQTFTASQGISYQWYLNGNPIAGATNQTYNTNVGGNYTVEVTNSAGCVGTSVATVLNVNSGVPASVFVTPSPNDTICVGTIVTFTAAPTNGGTNPSYQWKKNGLNVGINNAVYTGAGLVNGDQIEVVMTVGTNICTTGPNATSNTITMTVQNPTAPDVTIAANPGTTACIDDAVTFTATPVNGGTTPSYQWQVNGINVGTNSDTYTAAAGSLNSGDVVSVQMTPSLLCSQPAFTTENVTMTITPLTTPTVSISTPQTTICQGAPMTLTAADNAPGGTYQWYVNGVAQGPNNASFTYLPVDNDVVTLEFTPPAAGCYDNITVTSNTVGPITVIPGLPTMATVTSLGGAPQGSMVTVYANLFNFNTVYSIDWYINAALYTTTTVPYMTYTKGAGTESIYAIVNNSGSGCYLAATTNTITIEDWPTSVASRNGNAPIDIYPNPFTNQLVIKGLADGDHVILFNMLGQTMQEWKLEQVSAEQVLNVKDLAAGSYLLNVRDKDGNFKEMKKLQKQ
ncbi:MAG: T9SS type A sorting domain-containing protein [Flavipsychrobacter sp.]|nr:T9SS type A sorting domain-containing protein [Flavipsychrobacter sp.]